MIGLLEKQKPTEYLRNALKLEPVLGCTVLVSNLTFPALICISLGCKPNNERAVNDFPLQILQPEISFPICQYQN